MNTTRHPARPIDYRGKMSPEKAARLIVGWTVEDVVLAITGGQSLIRDHVITPAGPLPNSIVLDALGARIRAERARA